MCYALKKVVLKRSVGLCRLGFVAVELDVLELIF